VDGIGVWPVGMATRQQRAVAAGKLGGGEKSRCERGFCHGGQKLL
jgi:hypothetical protein